MRRKIIILCVSLALILTIQFSESAFSRRATDAAKRTIEAIETAVRAGDWQAAHELLAPLIVEWDDVSGMMDWWVTHAMTEAIRGSLLELAIMVDAHDFPHAMLMLTRAHDALEDLALWGELTLANVV